MEATKLKSQEPVADILVVDDTMENLDVLVSILSKYGYNVRPATSGTIALRAARSVPPDLVLLDIRMPDMDGYQVCQALKDDDLTRGIPIIFLTVLDEATEKVKAFAAGAVDYITKPFQVEEVAARVETHLRIQHLQKRLQEQNARLRQEIAEKEMAEEALQAGRNELERRVEERTAELRVSEEKYRLLADNATDVVWTLDLATLKFSYISPSVRRMRGYSPEEAMDLTLDKTLTPDSYVTAMTMLAEEIRRDSEPGVHPDRIGLVELRELCKDGSVIETEARIRPLRDANGIPTGLLGITRDISHRKRAEELAIRNERLKAIGDLAGGVAHNFNNLLQIVMGGIDYALIDAEMGNLSELKRTLGQLLPGLRSGAETVKRLQSFAQTRGEIQPFESEELDLSEIAGQVAEMTKPFWQTGPDKEGIQISLNLELTNRCYVNAKESEIMEVLVNLVKNAAEALPTGGEIRIKTLLQSDQVILQVIDNGVGIKREHLKKVFEPFWSTKGVSTGTGMGLAVSHGIVSRHRGTISVESEEGKGATVTVTLPLAKEPQKAATPLGPEILRSKLNILVVDDVALIVMHLEGILTKHRQTVFSAMSGEEALEIFRNNKIDMVICDLSMPGTNGWEVGKAISEICQQRGVPKTPFVLLTGWDERTLEQEKIAESAVDAIVQKPIDNKKLIATVKKVAEMAQGSC